MPHRRLVRQIALCLLLAALLAALTGCGLGKIGDKIEDLTTRTTNVLDDAISALTSQSAAWQQVLTETRDKLIDSAQSTVRNEVQDLLTRSIASAGGEFRCNADFIGDRVRQNLQAIRAKLLGQTLPPVEPGLCQVVPAAVDKALVPERVNKIDYFGYDFRAGQPLALFLEEQGGARQAITRFSNIATHYQMTVVFGGAGVQLSPRSERIVLEYDGRPISSVAVIQPQTPPCDSRTETVRLSNDSLVPTKNGSGDRDFDGNGPRVSGRLVVDFTPDALFTTLSMSARETRSDHTAASGSKRTRAWLPPPDFRIDQVLLPTMVASKSYIDNNTEHDLFEGGNGPVQSFDFVGDTEGDDVGKTSMTVKFNPIRVVLVRKTNCLPPSALKWVTLQSKFLAPFTLRRMQGLPIQPQP